MNLSQTSRHNAFRWIALLAWCWLGWNSIALTVAGETARDSQLSDSQSRRILVHYMPWFEARPAEKFWGWHWTMKAFDPNQKQGDRCAIASQYYPKIGPYDSEDPDVLEYQLLTMKLAGIDGVVVDWYGLQDFRDYAILHKNTQRLIELLDRYGMQFAICYEDQTVQALVEAGRISASNRVGHVAQEIEWMQTHWFSRKSYVRIDDRPILFSFGQSGLSDEEWTECLTGFQGKVHYFSEHHRRTAAVGAFDWPVPTEGRTATERFLRDSQAWQQAIPVAYPRFVDIYEQAKVHPSWGRIEDAQGKTLRATLEAALQSKSQVIQIATWNDWGEGTQLEPSVEFGYRDLELIQELRRAHIDPNFKHAGAVLPLPEQILKLRRSSQGRSLSQRLDEIVRRILTGDLDSATTMLDRLATASENP